jgi:hypothetical protein
MKANAIDAPHQEVQWNAEASAVNNSALRQVMENFGQIELDEGADSHSE